MKSKLSLTLLVKFCVIHVFNWESESDVVYLCRDGGQGDHVANTASLAPCGDGGPICVCLVEDLENGTGIESQNWIWVDPTELCCHIVHSGWIIDID